MELETIEHALAAAAPVAVLIGVIIALVQLRSQQHLREMDVVMRLYSTFGEEQFQRHYRRVTTWPYDSYEAYHAKGDPEDHISLMVVCVFFENMGLLLKRKFAPIELLDDLLSGPILEVWPKVRPIWVGLREEYDQPSWAEWCEFFYDAMLRRKAAEDGSA